MRIFRKENWIIENRIIPLGRLSSLGEVSYDISQIPSDYISFIEEYISFANSKENAWFLMLEDFSGQGKSAFAWNELEKQSLDAALDDADEKKIRKFWERHLPILLSVKDGYSFLAMEFKENNERVIVSGREPEYENTSHVCGSFSDLLDIMILHVSGEKKHDLLCSLI
jgi:hypothetical protein